MAWHSNHQGGDHCHYWTHLAIFGGVDVKTAEMISLFNLTASLAGAVLTN